MKRLITTIGAALLLIAGSYVVLNRDTLFKGELTVLETAEQCVTDSGKVDGCLAGVPSVDQAQIKATQILSKASAGTYQSNSITVQMVSLGPVKGGVQIYAKAWKNGLPMSFSNQVETERFIFYNPPVLVPDPMGTIISSSTNTLTKSTTVRTFREDPFLAIKQSLVNTINVAGSTKAPIPGSVGHTITTIYPSVDGTLNNFDAPRLWTTVHGASTSTVATTAATDWGPYVLGGAGSSQLIRDIISFNLTSVPAGTVSAVSFVLQVNSITDAVVDAYDYSNITAVTVATDGSIVSGDFGGFNANTTKYSTDKDLATMGTGSNTWVFNASGISYITTQIGLSKYAQLSSREGHDIENQDPGGNNNGLDISYSESSGTANDPNIVVTTGSGGSVNPLKIIEESLRFKQEEAITLSLEDGNNA